MRCKRCKGHAVIELRRHNTAYCADCFLSVFEAQVARAIDKQRMFTLDEPVLVAVSGGKDSLALWEALLRRGYAATGVHINLGIGDYSAFSQQKAMAFAAARGAPLKVIDVRAEFGYGIADLRRRTHRTPCAACGLIKRYLLNRAATEAGIGAVVTGHNLDDEASALLGNLLHWETVYLARQAPLLPSTHPKLARRAKPLFRIAERESAAYAILRGIAYVNDECPLAEGSRTILYKDALNVIEAASPGAKQSLLLGFLERGRPAFRDADPYVGGIALRECERCGQPTPLDVCAFCRLWDEVRSKARLGERPARGRRRSEPVMAVEEVVL